MSELPVPLLVSFSLVLLKLSHLSSPQASLLSPFCKQCTFEHDAIK